MAGLIKTVIGATGVGPVSNALQRYSSKGLNSIDRRRVQKLLKKITEDGDTMRNLEKEISTRGNFLTRYTKHLFDTDNKGKLNSAQELLDKLRRSTGSQKETVSNLQAGIKSRNKNIQDLLEDYPRQLGNMGTLYGSGALGAGGYYGAQKLLDEE